MNYRALFCPITILPRLLSLLVLLAVAIPRGLPAYLMVTATITLACFWNRRREINWRHTARQFGWPLAAYAIIALSVFYSASPRAVEMLRDSFFIVAALSVLFVFLPLYSADLKQRCLQYVTVALLIAFIYYVIQFICGFPFDRWLGNKGVDFPVMMTNIPKRPAAILLLLSWPAALYLYQTNRQRLALILLATIAIALLFFTSRASMIGAWGGLVMLGVALALPRFSNLIGSAMLSFIIPATVLIVMLLPAVDADLIPFLSQSGDYRLSIWDHALHIGTAAWPLGIGLDGSRLFVPDIPVHPHNIFLQIFLELGIAGVALISFLLGMLAHTIRHTAYPARAFLWGAAACSLLMLSIAYGLWQGWWLGAHGLAAFLLALACPKADKSL